MADEASMADETSIVSSSMEHGTSKEHETLMEIETFSSDSWSWVECVFDMLLGTKDVWVEAEQSELIGLKVDSENAAYEAYRRYSFIKCFGIRLSNLRKTNKGFMLNERTELFEWLYGTFLKSMGGIQPKTIMTDQSKAMSNAIKECFPQSKHRLCVWHLFKNSAAHLGRLKESLGFNKLFSRILKRCHTEEELNHGWNRMVSEYNCENHPWLSTLYELREKWCCAYGKDSTGALSSQRSESANNSLSKRVSKTTTLCDFYEIFGTVVSDWRSNERKDNSLCWEGVPEVLIPCSLFDFAAKNYTIGAFKRFQKEFTKGMSYKHKLQEIFENTLSYYVYTERSDEFGHVVTFDSSSNYTCCTCKRFEESGFLCRHILRIYHCNYVDEIPNIYVLKRWTKDAKPKDDVVEISREKVAGPVWRLDMYRNFHKLIIASSENEITRGIVNDCFEKAKNDIVAVLGGLQLSDVEEDVVDVIENPKGRTKKGGGRFNRKRSLLDIQTSRARGKFKASRTRARKHAENIAEKEGGRVGVVNPTSHVGLCEILMTPEDYH
ncbi:protein FAR-RED IMPAIRED RESPONSE 1-like [Silene latifolia]|uniref:protein FAR-RED IMPAIRED RESPONSE 1-like n=1 Tax=Silene latifolia TaxID=37657 RepID=UPI003D776E9D